MVKQVKEMGGGNETSSRQNVEENVAMHVTVTDLIERYGKEIFNEDLRERLRMDWDHNTMDYNSINFLEVFTMFKCDVRQSVAHWRISKILEGICVCSDQLKITQGISPTEIPKKIYKTLQDDGANEKKWPIRLVNPEKEDETVNTTASLADFAHFVNMLKTNRELGMHRFDMKKLAYNYFTNGDLKAKVSDDGEEKVVDLNDPKINPRDKYEDLDVEKYLEHIKRDDVQAGLQLMTEWRTQSDGHRELAGQALLVPFGELPADSLFIPLCGRLAARISMSDLQKQDKSGMMGQPQEVAEIDEKETGAFIRFNLPDLAQRRRGGDIRNVQKTQRMAKAMCGLVLNEDAFSQVETVRDETDKKEKKKIYLCGKKLDGAIITGMKTRYDRSMKRVRGYELSKDEAADIAMTDVFIPCILNNPNDWLTALATTYSIGGNKGAQSLLQNREVFQGFDVNIKCRNLKKAGYPIEWQIFNGFNVLWEYVTARVKEGHIDQPNVDGFVVRAGQDIKQEMKAENEYFLSTIDDQQGRNIYELFKIVLGDKTDEYVAEYVAKGKGAVFSKLPWAEKNEKRGKKSKYPTSKKLTYDFDEIIGMGLAQDLKDEKSGVEDLVEKLYEININEETDIDFVIDGLMQTLAALSGADRKKIHS